MMYRHARAVLLARDYARCPGLAWKHSLGD
jgi:hypothetical protein